MAKKKSETYQRNNQTWRSGSIEKSWPGEAAENRGGIVNNNIINITKIIILTRSRA